MSRYIDEELVVEALHSCLYTDSIYDENNGIDYISYDDAVKFISEIPTADVKPVVHGKWERGYSFTDGEYVKCTVCGEIIKCIYPMHFCPNCGSDNREVEE